MPYSPFNYGNALAQAEGIRGQQLKNRLLQNQLSAPPGSNIDPTANMRDIQFLRKMKDEGYSDDQIEIFKQAIVKRDAFLSDPMLNREGLAGNYIAGQKAAGGARGELAGNQGVDYPMFSPQAVPSTQLNTEGVNLGGQPRIQTKAEQEAQIAEDKEKAIIKARLGDEDSPGVADVDAAKAEAQYEQDYKWKGLITAKVKLAEAEAKEKGEVLNDLARMRAALPGLRSSVKSLKKLAEVATYTKKGKAWDTFVRESGFGATEGATARAEFIAIVDNQVLPLLRQTFGAAFTAEEGQRLRDTLADPDLSPQEKNAQLDAFIAQKTRDIETGERQLNQGGDDSSANSETIDFSTYTDEQLRAILEE